jgi:alcohol dehydrogenase class IV
LHQMRTIADGRVATSGIGIGDFVWQGTSSRVVLASGAARNLTSELDRLGLSRVMLVCGTRTAAAPRVMQAIDALGARLKVRFCDVPAHSDEDLVMAGVEAAREGDIDGLLAIGGGSASDTAKAIAIVLAEGGGIADHANVFYPPDRYEQKVLPRPKLPLIAVPMTASAAEVTPGLGIRARDGHKLVFWDPNVVPRTIVIDPELCLDMPVSILASTAMNAFAHCVEGLYSRVGNPISSALALHAARLLNDALPVMVADPADVDARGQVMAAAHLSGHVIANARVGLHHAICHGLGAIGGLSHGDANAIMLPHVMRYNSRVVASELAMLAEAMGASSRDAEVHDASAAAIAAVELLQRAARVPTRLRDVGFDRGLTHRIAQKTLSDRGTYFNPIVAPPLADIEAVIEAAW